jgi:single-stranded DNA-binding protein
MFQETLIIGNVSDPGTLQYRPDGEAVILFTVTTIRRFRDFDTKIKTETTIWRVSAWRKWAEWAGKNLKPNAWVQIRGRLSPDEKTGGPRVYRNRRNPAEMMASFELVARDMQLMGGVPPVPEDLPVETDDE